MTFKSIISNDSFYERTDFQIVKKYGKRFQNLRSGFPLERGIARLDFSKLMCASRQGAP
jgi:hypothetical protein